MSFSSARKRKKMSEKNAKRKKKKKKHSLGITGQQMKEKIIGQFLNSD
jgi:hypothetical protein